MNTIQIINQTMVNTIQTMVNTIQTVVNTIQTMVNYQINYVRDFLFIVACLKFIHISTQCRHKQHHTTSQIVNITIPHNITTPHKR